MFIKTILLCASFLFVEKSSSQCIGNAFNSGLGMAGNGLAFGTNLANGLAPNLNGIGLGGLNNGIPPAAGIPATSGGGLAVTSASPIAPTGLAVVSNNLAIEGPLAVGGELPFLGTAAVEGAFTTAGGGAISYGCGNGAVGITSEGLGAGPAVGPVFNGAANGFGLGGTGFTGAGLASPGIGVGLGRGCGSFY